MPLLRKTRVVVTGDLFRSFEDGGVTRWTQRPNVAWLEALVQAALPEAEITALTPESLGLTPAGLMAEQGLEASQDGWIRAFAHEPVGAVAAAVKGLSGTLVVGFELPPGLLSALRAAGAMAVNVALHPVRCLDDLLFSLWTDESAGRHFAPHVLQTAAMRWKLGRMRGRLARERSYAPAAAGRSGVLFGQMRVDRSQIVDGRMVSLLDFADRIREIAGQHDCLYFRPHPLEAPAPEVAEMLAAIPGVLLTDRNVYEMLDAPDIVAAYGISSSALYEAGLFGKPAAAFISHPDFGLPPTPAGLALDLDGFACGLASLAGEPVPAVRQGPGALREVVGQNWGLIPGAIDPLHRRPPVLPNQEVCLADPSMRGALVSGWRAHQGWGLWSVGRQGVLEFLWPERTPGHITVVLRMMPGASLPHRRPTLTVAAGGRIVYRSSMLRFDEPETVVFELAPPAAGRFQVHVFSSDPQTPEEVGINDDRTPLGAACFSIFRC